MKVNRHVVTRSLLVIALMVALTAVSARLQADSGSCGGQTITLPFTDVAGNQFFCAIAEAYFSALTNGTSATTYSPSDPVPREQMAAFITRTMDQSLKRGNRRAALNQWWTPQSMSIDTVALLSDHDIPATDVVSDGVDLWTMVANAGVQRSRGSDGGPLAGYFTFPATTGVVAGLRIYAAGAGTLTYFNGYFTAHHSIGGFTPNLTCITFDGAYVWTGSDLGVVSKTSFVNDTVTTVSTSFNPLQGMLFDGANVWVTETGSVLLGHIHRLSSSGASTLSVTTGIDPRRPVFDGTNIWVPNQGSNTVTVIRASTGVVLATLSGNGLNGPTAAAFDGQRILVTNPTGHGVSLWKAADLSPLGSVSVNSFSPVAACSDGVGFWVQGPMFWPDIGHDVPVLARF